MKRHICRAAWIWAGLGTVATAAAVAADAASGGTEATGIALMAGGAAATALTAKAINVLDKMVTNGIPIVLRMEGRSRATVDRLAKALGEADDVDEEDVTSPSEEAHRTRKAGR